MANVNPRNLEPLRLAGDRHCLAIQGGLGPSAADSYLIPAVE